MNAVPESNLNDLEVECSFEQISAQSGLDFRPSARSSLTRRIQQTLNPAAFTSVPGLQARALSDPAFLTQFASKLSMPVTAMFRDASLFLALSKLVIDRAFNEFHVILCRSVLIYFNSLLRERVHQLFYESLFPLGMLGLGRHETLC